MEGIEKRVALISQISPMLHSPMFHPMQQAYKLNFTFLITCRKDEIIKKEKKKTHPAWSLVKMAHFYYNALQLNTSYCLSSSRPYRSCKPEMFC